MSETNKLPSPEDRKDRLHYRQYAKIHAKAAALALELAEDDLQNPAYVITDRPELAAQVAIANALCSIAYSQMAPPVRVRPQHCETPRVVAR